MRFADSDNPLPDTVRLTPMMREFYRLRFVLGWTHDAIASWLGIARTAVVDREARILARFTSARETPPTPPGRQGVRVRPVRACF